MAGLRDTEVIDLVAEEPDGTVLLVIVQANPWTPTDIEPLKAKLNTYAQFILDGGLINHYPEVAGRPVRICIESKTPIPDAVATLMAIAHSKMSTFGIDLHYKVNPRL